MTRKVCGIVALLLIIIAEAELLFSSTIKPKRFGADVSYSLLYGKKQQHSEERLKSSKRVSSSSNSEELESFVVSNSSGKSKASSKLIYDSSSGPISDIEYASSPVALAEQPQQQQQEQQHRLPLVVPTVSVDEAFCDFGPLPSQSLCEWQDGCGSVKWQASTGLTANWLGGPTIDSTSGTPESGYGFVETSKSSERRSSVGQSGFLHSPQLASTSVAGTCLMFKYAMDGLSPAGMRILLHSGYDEFSSTISKSSGANETAPPGVYSCGSATTSQGPLQSVAAARQSRLDERILWNARYHDLGTWQQGQLLYTYPDTHTLIIEAIPVDEKDPSRSYRGYVAIDDIDLQPGTSCVGFCNFAGGFCDWTNEAEDDFDWSISRGSKNPTTGPVTDRTDSSTGGGYAYIDSAYPRRAGDVARLASVVLPASAVDSPQCMHFAFHMFGSGIGQLGIHLRHARSLADDVQAQEIWRLKGNAGNSWFDSRVTVASTQDFQLIFEASVGNTAMGDIAIDDVSFTSGPCPTSPQVAAPAHYPRDCAFEIDECDWINGRESSVGGGGGGDSLDPLPIGAGSAGSPSAGSHHSSGRNRVNWERVSQQSLNSRHHRKPHTLTTTRPRQEYFMSLQSNSRGGSSASAYLVSSDIKSSHRSNSEPLCLSFWYLMFESFIDAAGPSLGVLRVLVQPVGDGIDSALPLWQLYNNQGPSWQYGQVTIGPEKRDYSIVFEGTWGPNRANGNIAIDDIAFYTGNCSVKPSSASVRPQDCSFEKGLCGWENQTSPSSGKNDPRLQWQRAYPSHRPAQLLDKTFSSPGDFVFFDIFSPNQRREVKLRSPLVQSSAAQQPSCFTFWFVAFGVEESTELKIVLMSPNDDVDANDSQEPSGEFDDSEQVLWSLTAKGFNNPKPLWTWAQVTIEPRSSYRLILQGSASNGGFAIDDIKFQSQACPTRPAEARPASTTP
ncbi:MAM and LDL-receptor class A domain-containing protein 1-like [Trichogramma pretiosum]|uniref:MAM and LDL-receptor class A domain-containing protein 1-like n=1 Tax=Trichogramma pretiosum TaxID=7493 RepID=UPI0006C95F91|nr:MAM and LDL-receptor class A domain-containing protein 1-like [Trichogramma pretiosum]